MGRGARGMVAGQTVSEVGIASGDGFGRDDGIQFVGHVGKEGLIIIKWWGCSGPVRRAWIASVEGSGRSWGC